MCTYLNIHVVSPQFTFSYLLALSKLHQSPETRWPSSADKFSSIIKGLPWLSLYQLLLLSRFSIILNHCHNYCIPLMYIKTTWRWATITMHFQQAQASINFTSLPLFKRLKSSIKSRHLLTSEVLEIKQLYSKLKFFNFDFKRNSLSISVFWVGRFYSIACLLSLFYFCPLFLKQQ